MFEAKYSITSKLLKNIKQITTLTYELNRKSFSEPVLMTLTKRAHETSAYASTSIEGNPLPLTDVKRLLKTHPKHIRDSEREVLNYNKALSELEKLKQKHNFNFDIKLILNIHKNITNKLISKLHSGKIRQEAVFVNDPKIGKVIYWPPDHQDLNKLMKELLQFINKNKETIDPLILAGIFHKQFVIIHPFIDGNGRTVRLATKVLLSAMGLNTFKLFSFENYYNKNVTNYFKNVGVKGNYYDIFQNIDFTQWLEYFTDGIIDELLRISKILEQKSITPETILKEQHKQIIEHIKKHKFINDKTYSTISPRSKASRTKDFKHLLNLELIEKIGQGKATIYKLVNPDDKKPPTNNSMIVKNTHLVYNRNVY